MNEEEIRRTIELRAATSSSCRRSAPTAVDVDYDYPHMLDRRPEQPYNSSTAAPMSRDELRQYLRDNKFLDA